MIVLALLLTNAAYIYKEAIAITKRESHSYQSSKHQLKISAEKVCHSLMRFGISGGQILI
ncbi:MAG: hypothetical protein WBA93_06635 [Microcoleaceae cyanobacterium]